MLNTPFARFRRYAHALINNTNGARLGGVAARALAAIVLFSPPIESFAAPSLVAPTPTATFAPSVVKSGDFAKLTVVIANPNAQAITGVSVWTTYDSPITNAGPSVVSSNTCGGSPTAVVGDTSFVLTGGTIGAATSCKIVLNVVGAVPGVFNANVHPVTSSAPTSGTSTAALTITDASVDVKLTYSVDNTTPQVGDDVNLTLSAFVYNSSSPATGVQVAAVLPYGLSLTQATPSLGTSYDSARGIWNVGTLNGSAATLTLKATVTHAGPILSTSNIIAEDQLDPTTQNNSGVVVLGPLGALWDDVQLSMSVDNSTPVVGDQVTIHVLALLTGPTGVTGLQVVNQLPAGLQLQSVDTHGQLGSSYDPVTGIWTTSSSANAGVTFLLDLVAKVTQPGQIIDRATKIAQNEFDPITSNDHAYVILNRSVATPIADAQAVMSVDNAAQTVGQNVTFTIVATNNGPDPALGGSLTDQLPTGLTLVSATPSQGSYNSSTGVWNIGNLAGFATLSLVAKVDSAAPLTNSATISSSSADLNSANDSASIMLNGFPMLPPQIKESFLASHILVGGTSQLTIDLSNPNSQAITGTYLLDMYSGGMVNAASGVLVGNDCGGSITAPAGGSSLHAVGMTIPANGSCSLVLNIVGANVGTFPNATGSVGSFNAPTATGASATLTVGSGPLLPAAPTASESFTPASVPVGGNSQMTITLANSNSQAITGAAFLDIYPPGLANVATGAVVSNTCGGIATAASNGLSARLSNGTIPAGGSVAGTCSVVIEVTGTSSGVIDNHVGPVTSANAPTSGDANATLSVGIASADFAITKSHVGNFTRGEIGAQYVITVTNVGSAGSSGLVTVTDALPQGLVATTLGGVGWNCTIPTLTCSRSDALAASQAYPPITLSVNVSATATDLTNTASVSNANDANTSNDVANDATTISPAIPDFAISKTHAGSFSKGLIGAQYTITVSNVGGATSSGLVTVADTLPNGLTATDMSGAGWSCTLATLACARSDALAGGQAFPPITLTVDVAATAVDLTNTATVSNAGDLNAANNSASDATAIGPAVADFAIAKTHTGNFNAGQIGAQYVIVVRNVGGASTRSGHPVNVVDSLPAGLTATALSGAGWMCTLGTLSCTRSDALTGGGVFPPITLTVSVASNAPASVTNVASVASMDDMNAANDDASDATTIVTAQSGSAPIAIGDHLWVHASNQFDSSNVVSGNVLASGYRSVLANDQPQGLVAVKMTNPTHGTATLNADGTIQYSNTDPLATTGTDSFTYQSCFIAAPTICSSEATVSISVVAQGDVGPPVDPSPPIAVDDALIVTSGGAINTLAVPPTGALIGEKSSVLANDLGSGLQATVLAPPTHIATLSDFQLAPDGRLRYKNNGDGASIDSFTYQACDAAQVCAGATVTITIGAGLIDAPPIVVDDLLQVQPGATLDTTPVGGGVLVGGAATVLSNDRDVDAQPGEQMTAKLLSYPMLASAPPFVLNGDGTVVYQSATAGNDGFVYEACDAFHACTAGLVSAWITTSATDSLPVAQNDQIQVASGGVANVLVDGNDSLLANDQDADPGEKASLSASVAAGSRPSHGSIDLHPDGRFVYTNDGTGTTDSFDYEACDIHGGCSKATVNIGIGTGSSVAVACRLPMQVYIIGPTGADVDINVAALFAPPTGKTLSYSFLNLPSPPLGINASNHLIGTLSAANVGVYNATFNATTTQPPPQSASENVLFEVVSAHDHLFRNTFDGAAVQACH